jgi:hypothetical protein
MRVCGIWIDLSKISGFARETYRNDDVDSTECRNDVARVAQLGRHRAVRLLC